MIKKLKVITIALVIILICPVFLMAGQDTIITVTVAVAKRTVDPEHSTIEVDPLCIPIKDGKSTITVIPKDKRGRLLGSGQAVKILTSAGYLLDGVKDKGDGSYTQRLKASKEVEAATISAVVNEIPLSKHPKVYVTKQIPAKITMVSGNNQTGITGTTLKEPFVVKITDAKRRPVYGAPVTFAVAEGDGALLQEQPVTTDKKGRASAILTLGTMPGENVVTASLDGVEGSPVIFKATGKAPLIRAVWFYDLEKTNLDEQEKILGKLQKLGINLIYLDIEKEDSLLLDTPEESDQIEHFVESAHNLDMAVEAMILKDPQWIDLSTEWKGGIFRFDEVIRRVKAVADSGIPFAGIHIDVQPHEHAEWRLTQWEINNELMIRFQSLLGLIRDTITEGKAGLTFSATLAWWYNDAANLGILSEGDALILSYSLDYMVPIIFEKKNILFQYWYRETAGKMGRNDHHEETVRGNDNNEPPDRILGQLVYYCVIDEISELQGKDKGLVIGLSMHGTGSNEKISSLMEWLDNKLNPFNSYWGTAVRQESRLMQKQTIVIKCIGKVNLSVVLPDGKRVNKEGQEQEENNLCVEFESDQNRITEDEILITNPAEGNYQIEVIPESGALSTDRFSIIMIKDNQETVIADDVQIQDLPELPYVLRY